MPLIRAYSRARSRSRLATASARASSTSSIPPSRASLIRAVDRTPQDVIDMASYSTLSEHVARAFAPGRINLIGEHTDYNAGLALPFAVSAGVTVTATQVARETVEAVAHDLGEDDVFSLRDPGPAKGWRA